MSKKYDLNWNVFLIPFNNELQEYNIFHHSGFYKDVVKLLENKDLSKDDFIENVRKDLMYYFWSKCEYEIIFSAWPSLREGERDYKVDVYRQVMMNKDRFFEYLLQFKK